MELQQHTAAGSLFHPSHAIITGGTFIQNNTGSKSGFDRLLEVVAPNALHDSGHVVDPPKCHPGTRVAIIQTIIDWIAGSNEANRDKLFTWLNGAAGAGKSAIGRSVCERCKAEGTLLASFFFGSSDPTRNHSRSFAATISYQICCISQGLRTAVSRAIEYDPLIFSKSLQTQLKLLVMDPLMANCVTKAQCAPCVIVVDGLDECLEHASQRDILDAMLSFASTSPIRIRVLVCSRKENHIVAMFSAIKMINLLFKILLDTEYSSWDDIELYLRDQFRQIRETHIFRASIPNSWPTKDQLYQLTYKSSGQFIYASTVIGYVESSGHRPQQRLDAILGLRPPFKDLPFAELDAVYLHVLKNTENPSLAADIMAYVALYFKVCPADIDKLLGLETGETEIYLSSLAAIVRIIPAEGGYNDGADLLHKSFGDFLFDPDRSKELSKPKMETKARHALRLIEIFSERHSSCRFKSSYDPLPQSPTSLELNGILYEHWSPSLKLAFLNAVQNFPMNSYCEELFSHSGPFGCMENRFIYNFFSLLIDLGNAENRPSLYQYHFRAFCDCALRRLKSKYTDNLEINIKFTSWYLARPTRELYLPRPILLTPSFIRHLEAMKDNHIITHSFRLLLNKTDEALIIAKAAMFCLQYLCDPSFTREAAQRHLQASEMDRKYRKTRPWRWHRLGLRRDLARKVLIPKWTYTHSKIPNSLTTYEKLFTKDVHPYSPICPLHLFSCIYGKRTIYDSQKAKPFYRYRARLEYLVIILPRTGRFLPLIHLCKAKAFAPMSMMFPDQSRKARHAIATYLDRMEVGVGEEDNEMAIH